MEHEVMDHDRITLILTAFGPFGGVEENPSQVLLQEIPSFLTSNSWKVKVKERIQDVMIIDTSAQDATEAVANLAQKIVQQELSNVICLHLGVNVNGTGYHIEQCAYNDASFRIPDQRAYQPDKVPIHPDVPLGTPNYTQCPVDDLVAHLSLAFPAIESKVSTDPGRYVCNFLYYTSLSKLQNELKAVDTSLFLHIPKFDKIPKETQLEYLAEIMRVLTKVEFD